MLSSTVHFSCSVNISFMNNFYDMNNLFTFLYESCL